MPDGLSEEERVRWLRETGEALRRETGQPSGVTENQPGPNGQPNWLIWWSDEPEPDEERA
ncbi:MAG: hypothetical protein JOZ47_02390 [Kutzneria sp.]|nr:hypothetical protein [Kutzneria sp.]